MARRDRDTATKHLHAAYASIVRGHQFFSGGELGRPGIGDHHTGEAVQMRSQCAWAVLFCSVLFIGAFNSGVRYPWSMDGARRRRWPTLWEGGQGGVLGARHAAVSSAGLLKRPDSCVEKRARSSTPMWQTENMMRLLISAPSILLVSSFCVYFSCPLFLISAQTRTFTNTHRRTLPFSR